MKKLYLCLTMFFALLCGAINASAQGATPITFVLSAENLGVSNEGASVGGYTTIIDDVTLYISSNYTPVPYYHIGNNDEGVVLTKNNHFHIYCPEGNKIESIKFYAANPDSEESFNGEFNVDDNGTVDYNSDENCFKWIPNPLKPNISMVFVTYSGEVFINKIEVVKHVPVPVEAPSFSIASGEVVPYDTPLTINSVSGAEVYYKLQSSDTWTKYTEPLRITANIDIEAKAFIGLSESETVSASYRLIKNDVCLDENYIVLTEGQSYTFFEKNGNAPANVGSQVETDYSSESLIDKVTGVYTLTYTDLFNNEPASIELTINKKDANTVTITGWPKASHQVAPINDMVGIVDPVDGTLKIPFQELAGHSYGEDCCVYAVKIGEIRNDEYGSFVYDTTDLVGKIYDGSISFNPADIFAISDGNKNPAYPLGDMWYKYDYTPLLGNNLSMTKKDAGASGTTYLEGRTFSFNDPTMTGHAFTITFDWTADEYWNAGSKTSTVICRGAVDDDEKGQEPKTPYIANKVDWYTGVAYSWNINHGIFYIETEAYTTLMPSLATSTDGTSEFTVEGNTLTFTSNNATGYNFYKIYNIVDHEISAQPFSFTYNNGLVTSIDAVEEEQTEDAPVRFYNINGVRVDGELAPGVYIKQQGTKTEKVLVK